MVYNRLEYPSPTCSPYREVDVEHLERFRSLANRILTGFKPPT